MTIEQRVTSNALLASGYTVSTGPAGVLAVRGNDYRLVMADGSQKRAKGARR